MLIQANVYIYFNPPIVCLESCCFNLTICIGAHSISVYKEVPHSILKLHSKYPLAGSLFNVFSHFLLQMMLQWITLFICHFAHVSISLGWILRSQISGIEAFNTYNLVDTTKLLSLEVIPIYTSISNVRMPVSLHATV